MERADSPLVAAVDAVTIRTDDMDFEQTVSAVVSAIQSVACSDHDIGRHG
jgi:cytidylate kinase